MAELALANGSSPRESMTSGFRGGGGLAVGATGGELVTKNLGVGEGNELLDKPIPHLCFWPLSQRIKDRGL